MDVELEESSSPTWKWLTASVFLFWAGYLAITLLVGFATSVVIAIDEWQLIAWGFLSSLSLLLLIRVMARVGASAASDEGFVSSFNLRGLSAGFFIGTASFVVHVAVVSLFAGPISFEWVPGVGLAAVTIYFLRFFATSCMEEIGFRGYALRRLMSKMGPWPAVAITSLVFGLSHLSYGWEMKTILMGVVPCGMLWGMSAVATRGIAVPIGLHAAWNFASWTSGTRSEVGLLSMVVADEAAEQTQRIASWSYLTIFATMTIAYWLVYRRRWVQRR